MMMVRGGRVVLLVGWALLFGSADKGWRQVDTFDARGDCDEARDDRAREVREKSKTKPPLADVLKLYQCTEKPAAPAPAP